VEGKLNLNLLYKRIPPHERAYLFERCESRKQSLEKTLEPNYQLHQRESQNGRIIGAMPRESASLREYLSNMGQIERRLLNQEVRKFKINVNANGVRDGLTITEARSLLPEQTAREIRLRARNLAWERIAPAEAFERNPSQEAVRVSDTIAHIQEHLQEKASIAQNARNEFVADKVREAENRSREMNGHHRAGIEIPARMAKVDHERFVQSVIAGLSPEDAKKLAALDHYAADTREAVYRGFETIDAQKRDLDFARAQSELQRTESTKTFQNAEMNDRNVEFRETIFSNGHIDSDREWHFDSLRDTLSPEHVDHSIASHDRDDRIDHLVERGIR
jgi:hypothetical protein